MKDGMLEKYNDATAQGAIEPKIGLNVKTLIVSILFIAIVGLSQSKWLTDEPYLSFHFMPAEGGLAFVFLLLLVNVVYKKLSGGKAFMKRGEIMIVYSMLLVAGIIFSFGLMSFLPMQIVMVRMKALDAPKFWGDYTQGLSSWIVPTDDDVVFGFFEGGMSVPWGAWIVPILLWFIFWGVCFFVFMCIAVLFRKRWTDVDRLTFPMTVLPMTVTEEDVVEGRQPFWRNKLVYVGMIFPAVIGVLRILNYLFPSVPAFPIDLDLAQYFREPPLSVLQDGFMVPFRFRWDPIVIGLGYLIPLDVSFSMWFFFLVYRTVYPVILYTMGLYQVMHLPLTRVHLNGAILGYGIVTIWFARRFLAAAFKKAFTGTCDKEFDDEGEPMSYRLAVLGLIIGTVILLVFANVFLHISYLVMLLFMVIMYLGAITFARTRSEAGYTFNTANMYLTYYLDWALGDKIMGKNALGLSFLNNSLDYGYFDANPEIALQAFKMGDMTNVRRSSMLIALCIAFALSFVLGWLFYLPVIYNRGAYMLGYMFNHYGNQAFNQVLAGESWGKTNPLIFSHGAFAAIFAVFLGYMRTAYVWWPFNPIGFVIANNDWMHQTWGPMFIAWLIKFVILRYGGAKLYRDALPFFYGLMGGSVIFGLLASLVSIITAFWL